ncbi:MAG TPA: response regulator, partial [Longimicrobiales bacterium]|nr:response regulator [Longimicrobiales bacterium]
MIVVLAGVDGIDEALREAVPGLEVVRVDPGDSTAVRKAMAGAAAVVLSRAAYDAFRQADVPLEIPMICCVDPETSTEDLREMTRSGVQRLMFEPVQPAEVAREVGRVTGQPGKARDSDRAPALDGEIAAIWTEFRGTMRERLSTLERLGAELLDGVRDPDALDMGRTEAHKLHGSLGTFGQLRGSELAAEIEGILVRGAPSDGDVFRFTELVVELRRALDATDAARAATSEARPPTAGAPAPGTIQILVLDSEPGRVESLTAAALARGWRPSSVPSLDDVVRRVAERPPDVLVLDPAACEPERLDPWLSRLALHAPRIPVLFWSDDAGLPARLRAAAVGVRAFIERDLGADVVMERAAALLDAAPAGATILVVDDDTATVALVGALSDDTLRVVGLTSPLLFWDTLEAIHPDLLLLDMDMPHVSGLQLCRVVRDSARWAHLPIVFFTAHGDRETVTRAFRAGADDYIMKPVLGPELRARVLNRLYRMRMYRGGVGGSSAGGGADAADRAGAMARASTALAIARRHGEPVTVSVIRLSGEEDGDVRVPLSRVAGFLRDAARPEDLIARWSDTTLALCLYGMDAEAAAAWLGNRADPHPEDRWTATIGTAVFPGDGTRFGDLVDRAALRAGGLSDSAGDSGAAAARKAAKSERVDVVLVEDDEALAALLLHTLAARDFSTRWIRDGMEAAQRLTGNPPELAARVVLLDIGLPGLDGFTVLQRLAEAGATERTRVVMLTARSGEAEVLRALELGAFDHVPKPFSVAELLHRVRRALESGDRA